MKLVCPKDSTHKRFSASAHVTEDWVVDEHGVWLENCDEPQQLVSGPHFDVSVCHECGEWAITTEEEA